jgi:hypothetical protein
VQANEPVLVAIRALRKATQRKVRPPPARHRLVPLRATEKWTIGVQHSPGRRARIGRHACGMAPHHVPSALLIVIEAKSQASLDIGSGLQLGAVHGLHPGA